MLLFLRKTSLWILPLVFQSIGRSHDLQTITAALQGNSFGKALQLSRQALVSNPKDPRLWTLQGLAYVGLHDNSHGLAAFKQARTLSPDYLPALQGEAQIEFNTQDPAAKSTLNHLLSIHPENLVAHAMLGALSYRDKDCAAVVQHYRQSQQVIQSQPVALQQFGSCLLRLQKPQEAVPVFQQLTTFDARDGVAKYNLAVAQLSAHFAPDAIETLRSLRDPRMSEARVAELASAAYEMLGDTPKAVETLRAAILRNPKDEDLYLSFASLCLDHRSYEIGVKFLDAGLKVMPDSSRLYVTRGIFYVQLGNYESAAQDFESGERLDPVHSFGFMAKGLSQMQESKLDQALATTQAEINRNPNDAFLQYLKAETLRRQGVSPGTPAFEEALQAAVRAATLNPHFPLVQDLLGVLYTQAGKDALAMQTFQSALADDPANPSVLYHLMTAARKAGKAQLVQVLAKQLADAKRHAREEDVRASKYQILETAKMPERSEVNKER